MKKIIKALKNSRKRTLSPKPSPKQQPRSRSKDYIWNLSLLYASRNDPAIEKDMAGFEDACAQFSATYDVQDKKYLKDPEELHKALFDYEELNRFEGRPYMYFYYLRDMDASDTEATARLSLLMNRIAKAESKISFFTISLGKVDDEKKENFLKDERLNHFRVFLKRIFEYSRYRLSVKEENILNLKHLTSNEMWVSANDRILSMKTIVWKKKIIPISQAFSLIPQTKKTKDRYKLSSLVTTTLKSVSSFSEAELNAIVTDKKIDDELRGFKEPELPTIMGYHNDLEVVRNLIEVVTKHFPIAHRFYGIKAKLLKQKTLAYSDRAVSIGSVSTRFPFEASAEMLKNRFGGLNPKFKEYIDQYLSNGQIDAKPRVGKTSGAYCSGSLGNPTYLLLNHNDDYRSFTTFAHELGHAFHSELSKIRTPLYFSYSTSLAETASTLFESIARESIMAKLTPKERIIALHDKINEDIATIFRQVACYNFEKELHTQVREVGFLPKEEIVDLHNKHMAAYLGPKFKLMQDDGYFFVQWSHLRRFFYVYSYAYGMLTSKALLRKLKADPTFWGKIEQFLMSGGKDSPEAIMGEIGINLSSSGFFEEGIREIESDIIELETLLSSK